MQYNYVKALSCGNAIQFILGATAGERRWRLLRKENATGVTFTGYDDPAAYLVSDGAETAVTDSRFLINGVEYIYALYGQVAGVWSVPVLRAITPNSNFEDQSIDAQEIVRERIDATLQSMIQRNQITLSKEVVPVMSIPFYTQGGEFPVVTVLYGSGTSVVRGVGEAIGSDYFDGESWIGSQGWHSAETLEVSAWSLNAQERNTLRQALQAVIAANLLIFDNAGLYLPEVQSVRDTEDTQSMNAPIYQTTIQIGYQVAVAVADSTGIIRDVFVNLIE